MELTRSAPGRRGRDESAKAPAAREALESRAFGRAEARGCRRAQLLRPVLGMPKIVYEVAGRTRGTSSRGRGLITCLLKAVGPVGEVDSLHPVKRHRCYHESDHVLNITYNALCGYQHLDDI